MNLTGRAIVPLMVLWLGGCQVSQSAAPRPTSVVPKTGMGVLRGKLAPIPEPWRGKELFAYAATYLGPSGGEGVFVLDANLHPKATLDSQGWFQIVDIRPGPYVLVLGPDPDNASAFRKDGKAIKFQVEAGEVVDVGTISLPP